MNPATKNESWIRRDVRARAACFAVLIMGMFVAADAQPRGSLSKPDQLKVGALTYDQAVLIQTHYVKGEFPERSVYVPAALKELYSRDPAGTLQMLLLIVEGARPTDAHTAAVFTDALESPEAAIVAASMDPKHLDELMEDKRETYRDAWTQIIRRAIQRLSAKGANGDGGRKRDGAHARTLADKIKLRQLVYEQRPEVDTAVVGELPRLVVKVPAALQEIYARDPAGTLQLLLMIVRGARPADAHTAAVYSAALDNPAGAVTAVSMRADEFDAPTDEKDVTYRDIWAENLADFIDALPPKAGKNEAAGTQRNRR